MHRRSGTERTSTLSERCIELGETEPETGPDSETPESETAETMIGSSNGFGSNLQPQYSSRSELSREVQELEVSELQSHENDTPRCLGDAASMQVSVCAVSC
jgi:hypothetical protein